MGKYSTEGTGTLVTEVPKIGDDVYLPTRLYLSHGRDDFIGGLCRVVDAGKGFEIAGQVVMPDEVWIEVAEKPGVKIGWNEFAKQQDQLREKFGDQRGYADPDLRPEFNDPW